MLDSVTIVDDSGRLNARSHLEPTDKANWGPMKADLVRRGLVQKDYRGTFYFPLVNDKRQRVQTKVSREVTVSGQYLKNMVNRARRFIRNAADAELRDPPGHIGLAMLRFLKADPDGFKMAMEARA